MEEEVYEVPRLPIGPYIKKLHEAIDQDQIRERYEDLGLEITSDQDLFDSKTELGYFFEGELVIFEINEPELLKELDPDALAINKLTAEGKTIISLQKILFEMDSSILPIVLQQQLDEVLFISEGMSPKDTYDEARELISSEDRARIKEALKIQLDLEPKQLAEEQRKTKLIAVASKTTMKSGSRGGRRKKVKLPSNPGKEILEALIFNYKGDLKEMAKNPNINTNVKTLQSWLEEEGLLERSKKKKPNKEVPRKYKKYDHPGKEKLKQLIIKYQAKLSNMAEDPDINASQPTLSAWINKDPELKQLAEEHRRARAKKPRRPDISKIKTLDELKALLNSGKIIRIPWSELPLELHRALVLELAQKRSKEPAQLRRKHYDNTSLDILHGQTLSGLYHYYSQKNSSGRRTREFILEELELMEKAQDIKEDKSLLENEKEIRSNYPGDEALKKLIIKYKGNLRKIANDSSVQVASNTVMTWINDDLELRRLATEQRQHRKSRKTRVRVPSNPGKEILEALIFNYEGNLKEMAKNPNINTDVKTLRSWIKEEGIESLVG